LDFDLSRLRQGELIAGGGAVLLAASLFLMPWYAVNSVLAPELAIEGRATSWDGWNGLTHLRWLLLIMILLVVALVWLQATQRAPALPVTFGMVVTVFGLITTVALLWRVLLDSPSAASHLDQKYGEFVGLAAAAVIFYGGYRSIREEGLPARDERKEIEVISLRDAPPRQPAPS
jgi:hypothetical protein